MLEERKTSIGYAYTKQTRVSHVSRKENRNTIAIVGKGMNDNKGFRIYFAETKRLTKIYLLSLHFLMKEPIRFKIQN